MVGLIPIARYENNLKPIACGSCLYLKKLVPLVVIGAAVDVTRRDPLFQISYSHKIIRVYCITLVVSKTEHAVSLGMYKKYLCITNEYQEPKKLNNQQIK